MAALLVVLGVMSVLSSVALPAWRHAAQREREAELIFRGEQYARAVMLYQRRTPGAWPPDVDTLVEGRFLRRAYRDPMTAGGEFRLVLQSELAAPSGPGASGGTAGDDADGEEGAGTRRSARERPGFGQGARPFGERNGDTGGVDGNVVGVASRSERTSIALYKGKSKYSEWLFVGAAPAGAEADGSERPGPSPPDSSAGPRGGDRRAGSP